MGITGLGPTLPSEGTFHNWSGGNSTSRHYYAHFGSETSPTYPAASHPLTRGVRRWDTGAAKTMTYLFLGSTIVNSGISRYYSLANGCD
ncbi:hypothetical protein AVEN_26904-1 [Araneus ventricosus]|uniref:Uncharacterized protein n=1 Tax=Araneus ventricosus TaxID=182803 RepID=A0A4Y2U4A7_ARAVE|nr:hypothetical protein AVEN_26904-1 [Araneus ventricosus]